MRKVNRSKIIIILVLVNFMSYAQKAKESIAEKNYGNFAYIDAIKTYERLAEKGYRSKEIFENLANSYYFNAELDKAAKWYAELFTLLPTITINTDYYYRYAQSLRSIGQDQKAQEMLKVYNSKADRTNKGEFYIQPLNLVQPSAKDTRKYIVKNASQLNSAYSDYGSAFNSDNQLIFTSARDTAKVSSKKHTWTNQSFTDFYKADLKGDSLKVSTPTYFSDKIRSKYHEASAIFTRDGSTMYFTRNNYLKGKRGKNEDRVTLLKIYKASYRNKDWTDITELPFTSDNYSTAHPALSPDEKTLYFVSDMPGTKGLSDIFKVSIAENGAFGTPINLGSRINTAGRETFPYVTDQNELYFASDTHSGFGGLDIFVSTINDDGTFGEVQNLGNVINSNKDDFAFLINTKYKVGFFSSNRDGGKGYDDIYQFYEQVEKNEKIQTRLSGTITDLATSAVLPGAKITLFDDHYKIISSTIADHEGAYNFSLDPDRTYSIKVEMPEFLTTGKTITIAPKQTRAKLDVQLEKATCKVALGDDLGKCFGIKWIYFDLDKFNIRYEAALDLAKILDAMNQYPMMKIDIRSHTDSRASFTYNKILSDRRAKSTKDWLIKNGIAANRLTSEGYGEAKLYNHCSDGVSCTEEEHQQNRRSEFIIVGL